MDMLFSPPMLRILLLAVLFAPLGFAVVVGLTRDNARFARRLAGLCAAIHLGLTAFVVAPCAITLAAFDQSSQGRAQVMFRPVAVPGDSGDTTAMPDGSQEHSTTWNLFFVGEPKPGMPPPAVQFFVGLDGVNIWLVMLASVLTYIAVMASWGFASERAGWYYAWMFVLQTAVTGAFLSFDVILFYVFFELTLIPAFFLIGGWGTGGGKRDAARKFFLYTFLGSLLTLIGVVGIVLTNPTIQTRNEPGQSLSLPPDGPLTFNVNRLMMNVSNRTFVHDDVINNLIRQAEGANSRGPRNENGGDPNRSTADVDEQLTQAKERRRQYQSTQFWLFFALIAGFVVKIPLVPFHTWLPSAYAEAPPAVTLLLTGLLAKLGTLGLFRIVIPLCPDMAVQYGLPVFGLLGGVGVVYAAFCAFAQKDIKLMAAYSSVSHLGLLVLGTFALNTEGLTGGVLHMVNHGLTAGALFALLAVLYDRYRTTDMTRFGGLLSKHPRFAFFTFVICLAAVGLPGLNNFVSEMLLISSLFTPWNTGVMGYGLAVAAAAGIFLSAWYTFTMLRKVFFGPTLVPDQVADTPPVDLTGRETLAFSLVSVLILALGLFPQPVLDTMKGDVRVIELRMLVARLRSDPGLTMAEHPNIRRSPSSPMAPDRPPGPPGPGGRPGGPPGPGGGRPPQM